MLMIEKCSGVKDYLDFFLAESRWEAQWDVYNLSLVSHLDGNKVLGQTQLELNFTLLLAVNLNVYRSHIQRKRQEEVKVRLRIIHYILYCWRYI
jgi:hypothetical protein